MSNEATKALKLADYCPPAFRINKLELEFHLQDHSTLVKARSQFERVSEQDCSLILDGEKLLLEGLWLDGEAVRPDQQNSSSMTLDNVPKHFELEVHTRIDPAGNTSLDGLYKSGGAFCTQCEAHGFRRITYFLDRPDVMTKYRVKIIADKARYPYLLSNGNLVEQGELDKGLHFALWEDPFVKPSYLFALVAGDFDLVEDSFTTQSGRRVKLQLFVDKGRAGRGQHAMTSLKKAMAWDEQRYGLEYDLDIYMIVAVDFFNMGAMENKGLNIFNSKYVLADPASATDDDYFNIESIIAHEYFHNWTGNRITCRDWFQLSLKEGLTVFRDQQFSTDMSSSVMVRIKQVKVMREQQFAEDAGPMSHPIRPEEVMEMNNFYSVTVYDKGAEVIRMLHTILGEAGYRKGMGLYVQRHDGQAVTCDDFVKAMQDANGVDLSLFRRWYSQSGTPIVEVKEKYDEKQQSLQLDIYQKTLPTADQKHKQPLHIPIALELIQGPDEVITRQVALTQGHQQFTFEGLSKAPSIALLANFSAPVKLKHECSREQLRDVAMYGKDPFVRWDSAQTLISQAIHHIASGADQQNERHHCSFLTEMAAEILPQAKDNSALVAEMLDIPSFETLCQQVESVDVDTLLAAANKVKQALAMDLQEQWYALFEQIKLGPYEYESGQVNLRRLRSQCLLYLAASGEQNNLVNQVYAQSDNMTDCLAALKAAQKAGLPLFADLMQDFEQKWQHDNLVMDKWFALHAGFQTKDCLSRLDLLKAHQLYDIGNPNRVRAVMGTFAFFNALAFHQADGSGYRYLTDYLLKLDPINPQVASRLVTPLIQNQHLDVARREKIRLQLARLMNQPGLSRDLFEKVGKSLGNG
ncbi:aminopeptidase N [Aliiglaciecola sp. CAU 1673]|uniref:aminopeptidase N n=1 Tax=Aliiglaciecola sp. CAU 1673 TaxID=3032595 RepID=UPI0023DAB32A|nr:aminopeptidase N [Aliiglaciecola sp. CAU 1673]MDF2177533.1 aminopeptidase N [Aliiglaciecola sp. CAU 1673]